jgi:hypothetical protein
MKVISYFLREVDLKEVDIIGLYQVLTSIGYICKIGNGLLVQTTVGRYESRQHVKEELRMDIEALLERFRIKK